MNTVISGNYKGGLSLANKVIDLNKKYNYWRWKDGVKGKKLIDGDVKGVLVQEIIKSSGL
jgi:hypothetical protein